MSSKSYCDMNTDDITGYDLTASQYSHDGRIYQIEYAQRVAEKSGNIVALKGKDCVVFAVDNHLHCNLYEKDAATRLFKLDNLGCVVAGFLPDGRHLVDITRNETSDYKGQHGEKISTKELVIRLAMYIHAATLPWYIRPYGTNLILGSYDHNGPRLTCIDPSGESKDYVGCALGKDSEAAKTEIEGLNLKNMNSCELIREAARIIYAFRDEGEDKGIIELGWIGRNTGGQFEKVPIKEFHDAVRYAKDAIEESD